jgi:hypothetical protein
MKQLTFTIRYEVHEGDVTERFLMPIPETGIADVVHATIADDGQWTITGADADAHPSWIGRGEYKREAILNYLKMRLGLYEESEQ